MPVKVNRDSHSHSDKVEEYNYALELHFTISVSLLWCTGFTVYFPHYNTFYNTKLLRAAIHSTCVVKKDLFNNII